MAFRAKYVAYLDILGFKELIERNELKSVLELYDKVISVAFSQALTVSENNSKGKPFDYAKLNYTIISDSIIVWSDFTHPNAFIRLLLTVNFILNGWFREGVMLRGAISVGEVESITPKGLNSPIIMGRGITDAYRLESLQQWAGCIISDEAVKEFNNSRRYLFPDADDDDMDISPEGGPTMLGLEGFGVLTRYNVPLKSGRIEERYVIAWPNAARSHFPEAEAVRTSFAQHNKDVDNWDVEAKIRNTLAFLQHCKDGQSKLVDINKLQEKWNQKSSEL